MKENGHMEDHSQEESSTSSAIPGFVLQQATLLPVHSLPFEVYKQMSEADFIDEQGVVQGRLVALVKQHLPACKRLAPSLNKENHFHVIWLNSNDQMRIGLVPFDWYRHRLVGKRLLHQHCCIKLLSELLALRLLATSSVTHYTKHRSSQPYRFEVELNQYHLQLSRHICGLVEQQQEMHTKQSQEAPESGTGMPFQNSGTQETQLFNSNRDDIYIHRFPERTRSLKKPRPSLAQQLERTTKRIIGNLHRLLQSDQQQDQDVRLWLDQEQLPEPDALWSLIIQKKQRLAEYEQRLEQVFHQVSQLDQIFVLQILPELEQRSTQKNI